MGGIVRACTRNIDRWLEVFQLLANVEPWLLYLEAHGFVDVVSGTGRNGGLCNVLTFLSSEAPSGA